MDKRGQESGRFTAPNKNHTAVPRQPGVGPGSFIYTVKVTSEFLRLERP